MTLQEQFEQYAARTDRTHHKDLEALFDALPAVPEDFMLGEWTGGVFNTGHPGEKMLGVLNWIGKTFHSLTDVNPII